MDDYGDYDYPYQDHERRGGRGGYEEDYYPDPSYEPWDGGGGPGQRQGPGRKGRKQGKQKGGMSIGGVDITGTITTGNKKWGIIGIAASFVVTMMGVSLFFEKNLMRLGNIMFVGGVSLLIGPSRVVRYFSQASKLRGTIIFMLGFFLLFTGHPIPGLILEVFGFMNLFGNMLPMFAAMARNMPIVKDILPSGGGSGKGKKSKRGGRRPPPPPPKDYDYGYDDYDPPFRQGGGYDDYYDR
ncbi:unnamed protein product [Chrysoparadoxa australica]